MKAVPSSTIVDIVLETMEDVLVAPSYDSMQELVESFKQVNSPLHDEHVCLSRGDQDNNTNNGIILTNGLLSRKVALESRIFRDSAFFGCSFGSLQSPPEEWSGISPRCLRSRSRPSLTTRVN
jgi:hypothetical protein